MNPIVFMKFIKMSEHSLFHRTPLNKANIITSIKYLGIILSLLGHLNIKSPYNITKIGTKKNQINLYSKNKSLNYVNMNNPPKTGHRVNSLWS